MFLVQILLPLRDNQGAPFGDDLFRQVRAELLRAFGGVTAYLQSPAQGVWRNEDQQTSQDEVVLVEVMIGTIDRSWWSNYRDELEVRFGQHEMLIRAHEVTLL
jgi:hypothetical protein